MPLNGTDYEDAAELEVCTLENAIYMGMKNDVSFLFDSEKKWGRRSIYL